MFGLKPAAFLDRDLEDWSFETWAWLTRSLGGHERLARTLLITPSKDFFPPTEAKGHERALHIFDRVKAGMGMQGWDCELIADERPSPRDARVGEFLSIQTAGGAAGTFQASQGKVVITYAADLVDDPMRLIAVMSHELAHYLLATIRSEPPGGEEAHELATELAVAFCGFGVFGANAAFHFEQYGDSFGQGWRSSRNGYLSERTWAFLLALFLHLTGRRGAAETWVKPSLRSMLKAADAYLARRGAQLDELRAITAA